MENAASSKGDTNQFEVICNRSDFDERSGNFLERLIFNNRLPIVIFFAILSVFLGWQATKLVVNANFEHMVPQSHPWIQNYFANKKSLAGLGNSVRIVVENTQGDIFDPEYLEVLRKATDTIYLVPGVDRPWVKSLWMPIVRWMEVIEEGTQGGPVMPDDYDGSPESIREVRANVLRAGIVGSLVANNMKSSMLVVPLLDKIQDTGKPPVDYAEFNSVLEGKIRALETPKIKIHIIGFAKLVGDLIDGLLDVMKFFGISVVIAAIFVYLFTRCLRSTLLLVGISVLGVVWLLGLMHLLGYELDPYSILVPFLVFAIGLSHGAQKMNGIMQDIGRGTHKYVAARYTFRRLFLAGLTALLTNVVGFAVLMIIDVPVIRDLAMATSIGVGVLIFTKLMLIPILLSYIGVSPEAAKRSLNEYKEESRGRGIVGWLWAFLDHFTRRRWATGALCVAAAMAVFAYTASLKLQIGDLDAGAPELRPLSRYNRDVAFINKNYGLSNDVFAVIVKTAQGGCESFETMTEMVRLSEVLRDVKGVQAVISVADGIRQVTAANFEANPKWTTITRDETELPRDRLLVQVDMPELTNNECIVTPLIAYLADHKADTLNRVAAAVEAFAQKHDRADRKFLLAAGTAGIEAATNVVVKEANTQMLLVLYSAVVILCFITFRNWRAVIVALIPLLITSSLCEALMVKIGIGIKVATLPVIALGVGVGVDYALYLLSVQLALQRQGETLSSAYKHSLDFTGKIVGLVGVTMAAGVFTWVWSPIKFQADMGLLLSFMFLWNMIGALLLIPALSHFLLGASRTPSP